MKKGILLAVTVATAVLLAEKWIARFFVSSGHAGNRLYSSFDRNKNLLYRLLLFLAVEVLAVVVLYLLLIKFARLKTAVALGVTLFFWLLIMAVRLWIL